MRSGVFKLSPGSHIPAVSEVKFLVSKAVWRNAAGDVGYDGSGAPTHYEYRIIELDGRGEGELHDHVILRADVRIVAVIP